MKGIIKVSTDMHRGMDYFKREEFFIRQIFFFDNALAQKVFNFTKKVLPMITRLNFSTPALWVTRSISTWWTSKAFSSIGRLKSMYSSF